MILQPFNQALTGSKFEFLAIISNRCGKSDFKDSSSLLNHIDKLLQIFNQYSPYAYKFYIESPINENNSTHILAAILQFDAIIRCSKIRVEFHFWEIHHVQMHLPIEAIGNWLNLTYADGQEHNERFLKLQRLEIHDNVLNFGEMFEHSKKVCHFFLKLLQLNV